MPKLNQIIAIEKGAKTNAEKVATEVYHQLQVAKSLEGMVRTYKPNDAEDPEKLPDEVKLVQVKANEELVKVFDALTKHFDIAATKEMSNCTAKADIKVGTAVIAKDVPVGFLLFLEKQLVNIATQLKKAPVLDPAFSWKWDENKGCYVSDPVTQNKTRKVMRNHVKTEATKEHPAQVETYTEDIVVGHWSKTEFSGALPRDVVKELIVRAEALQEAVKLAREEANSIEAKPLNPGKAIFDYLSIPLGTR